MTSDLVAYAAAVREYRDATRRYREALELVPEFPFADRLREATERNIAALDAIAAELERRPEVRAARLS